MRCRQPEKILFPPQLPVFTAELHQFSAFLAGQWALAGTTELTAIDAGLTDPLGQAAHWNAEALGHSRAGQTLSQAKGNSFLLLLRREPPACTVCLGWSSINSLVVMAFLLSTCPPNRGKPTALMGSVVVGAGVNPADQRWGFCPLLPTRNQLQEKV